ncbi:RNA polymerase sigma factor [Runella sp.]|uniref:RNA polymerase sigma factor n=1 Tax=Runella sp. TaxID=1960881 RepID=UPI0026392CD6|nr:sigma-70 family RNA polymerase sigma factor [Runella sp.]
MSKSNTNVINLPTLATNQTDTELWLSFKQGSDQAFEQLYRQYAKSLAGYGYRIVSNRSLVEDAIHDLFMDLWRRREFLSEVSNVKFYLFRALRNQLSRTVKNDVLEGAEDVNDFLDYLVTLSGENQSFEVEAAVNRSKVIETALGKLTNRQREAIHLRFYQELTLDETAELMALPKQVVKNLLSKSYAVLRLSLRTLISVLLLFILR